MRFSIRHLSLLFVIFLVAGCASTKKRNEVSPLGKFWHDTNARFNGYYNASLTIDESIASLDMQHRDNYTKILAVYPHVAVENPQAEAPNLDIVIEKATINITLHEPSNWTDDNYLLIGQSQYLKQDYETAETTLEYTQKNYSPEALAKIYNDRKGKKAKKKKKKKRKKKSKKPKRKKRKKVSAKKYAKLKAQREAEKLREQNEAKRKKKDDKPPKSKSGTATAYDFMGGNGGAVKHKPAYQEILLWLARTYIERDNYSGADYYFRVLEANAFLLDDVSRQLPVARAHMYLKRRNYKEAIPHLQQAVERSDDRPSRGRYAYILGQLLEMEKQYDEANVAFLQAAKYSNAYEMQFHARLKQTELAWRSGKLQSRDALRQLERMVKDGKNVEYTGEIYYTMAKIAMDSGDPELAMEYYQKALSPTAQTNPAIKAEIYNELASMFYEREQYVQAKAYYDSTLMVMQESDERYRLVKERSNSLVEIASLMQFITDQDSLLAIANMSEKDRRKLAEEMRKAEAAKQAQAQKNNAAPNNPPNATPLQPAGIRKTSNWAFYNTKKVERGIRSFEDRWGKRTLEDNWRRKNRDDASIADNFSSDNSNPDEKIKDVELTEADYAELFANVPFEAAQQLQIQTQLDSAIFTLGTLLRDNLQNYTKTISTLNEHLQRFPSSKFNVQTHYYLYLAHRSLGEQAKAQKQADIVCQKYPESIYCRIINDPESVAAEVDGRKQAQLFYEQTYEAFTKREYEMVLSMVQQVPEKFGTETGLEPKFALIGAMAKGNLGGKDAYLKSLREVAGTFKGTAEATRAKEIMRLLGASVSNTPTASVQPDDKPAEPVDKFIQKDDDQHYGLLVLRPDKLKDQEARIAMSDYHEKFHKLDKLKISSMALRNTRINTTERLLVIRRFSNADDAKRYRSGFMQNVGEYLEDPDSYEFLFISRSNYRTILKEQRLDEYQVYFDEIYN